LTDIEHGKGVSVTEPSPLFFNLKTLLKEGIGGKLPVLHAFRTIDWIDIERELTKFTIIN